MHCKDIQQQLKKFETTCRNLNLKVTHQRLEIFHQLLLADDHPTAEILHSRLAESLPTLSLDTVYRTLTTYEKHNLIRRIETKESHARYEIATTLHHHFICDDCGQVKDFFWPDFDTMPAPGTVAELGQIRRKNAVIHGICPECSKHNSE
ncbi:Fur family transcriptional regulator [Desulfogranum japonicum]|uniref:Fur family transcriptional regulator n=1 Tax=Desulfogranum japonicum TaxID=231447 RepID=UPI00048C005C|nr:Fur family transcriptional regulator [Desulfogranum japonicum]